MFEFLSNLCLPAMVYLILVIIGIVFGIFIMIFNPKIVSLLILIYFMIGIFIKLLWVWLLNFLCIKNHEGMAWFLFFLPYIIIFIIFYVIYNDLQLIPNHTSMESFESYRL